MASVVIAGVQTDSVLMDKPGNLERVVAGARKAAAGGAKLIVFPECMLTGYCYASLAEALPFAESVPGPSTDALTALCKEIDAFVVVGMLERDGDRLFNAAVLVGPTGLVGSYRKIHLPFLGIDRFASHGDRPFAVQTLTAPRGAASAEPWMRVGMNICYDNSFPETSRALALLGADVIALPTNWPPAALCNAEYVLNTRSMENHAFHIAVNRIGDERGFHFIGHSKIVDCSGKTLAYATHDKEEILFAEIDPLKARNKHLVRVPNQHEIHRFRDRRPSMYGPLTEATEEGPRR